MRLIDADALIQDMIEKGIPFNADINEAILNAREIGGYADYVDRVWEIAYERGKEEAFQWIPCSKRLPDEAVEVFIYVYGNVPVIAWVESGRWCTEDYEIDKEDEPVAWMPLPKPYERR